MYHEKISNYIGYSYLSRCYSPLKTSSCGIRVEAFKDFLTENGCGLYAGNIVVPARRACARAGIVDFGIRRNAEIAMGNSGNKAYIQALKKVCNSENEQVRKAAQWAIGKLEKIS